MKLYSKGQVFRISLISVLVTVVILTALEVFYLHPIKKGRAEAVNVPASGSQIPESGENNDKNKIFPVQNTPEYCDDERMNIDIYQRLNEAVVNISTEIVTYNWFLEPVPREGGTGSGSIIDARGYVLTNRHVVENAFKVKITLSDGTQYDGKVVGADPENDLAIVQFDPGDENLVIIPMGISADLKVGQKVLAIGNPFGYARTLTTGIVSGLGRPVRTSNNLVIKDMIQTDASINPGNSGGPLINSQGEMIGINAMIYSPSGGSVGIGFAVSVDTARRVVPDLMKYGTVKRGWIDIVPVQLFPQLVRYADLPVSKGVLVSKVTSGGNAEKAGIRGGTKAVQYGNSTIYLGGDIIEEVDGAKIETLSDLYGALEDNKPGDTVSVLVLRGKRRQEFRIELSQRPASYQLE